MPVVFFHGVLGFLPYGLTIDLLAEMHAGAIYLPIFPTWAVAAPGTYPIFYSGASGVACKGDALQEAIDSGQLLAKYLPPSSPTTSSPARRTATHNSPA